MSAVEKVICELAFLERLRRVLLWERFLIARFVAVGEMSMPWMWRVGIVGERMECRRSGMQPVPVQRSRMRRVGGGVVRDEKRRWARWVVRVSVSGL